MIHITKKILPAITVGLAALTGSSISLHAVSGSWTLDGGTGLWSDVSNWDSAPFVPGTTAGDVIDITNVLTPPESGITVVTVTINETPRTAGVLNIGHTGGRFHLNASGGGYLTMDNAGNQAEINFKPSLNNASNFNQPVISAPIRITTGGLKIYNESGINRTITGMITNTTNNLQWLTLNSTGSNVQLQGVIGDGDGGGQLGVLWDLAGGVGFMTTNNTYSGGTTIRRGSVRSGHDNAFGTGTVTLGDASTSGTAQLDIGASITLANNIVASSAATSGTLDIAARSSATAEATVILQGTLDVQRALSISTFGTQNTPSLTFTGAFSGAGRITANGNTNAASFIRISGNNTSFSGGITTTNNLLLELGHNAALGTGTLILNGATNLRLDATQDLAVSTNPNIEWNNDFTFVGSNRLNLGTGAVTLGGTGTARKVTVTDSVLGINGVISGARGLTKDGAGTLELNGTNLFSGDTTIEAGTLQGKGALAGNLLINGARLSTGREVWSNDTLDVSGSLTFAANSIFEFVYNSSLVGAPGVTANEVTIGSGTLLQLLDLVNGTVQAGTIFTVITNTSGNAITGTFSGLDEGSMISFGSQEFLVSYVGGTGNDFTLTAIPEPTTAVLFGMVGVLGLVIWQRRRRTA